MNDRDPNPTADPRNQPTAAGEELPEHLLARLRIVIPGYKLLSQISQGGQAIVFKAIQESTSKTVAVKLLREGPLADETARQRLHREMRVLSALNHPNIVGVIDSGQTADGHEYLVMNYIAGRSLDEFMKQCRAGDEDAASDPAMLLRLFMKICDAVNAAHLRGITHRDLSPSNILIDERNEPYVLDFGLARTAFERFINVGQRDISVTGQFLGKLAYASPEQARGDPDKIDIRTDVYALGVILYQILTGGEYPYEVVGNIADVLNNIIHTRPTPPSKLLAARNAQQQQRQQRLRKRHPSVVNPIIEAIVLKALEKEPTHRYQSAGELSKEIGNYLSGQPTMTRPGAGAIEPARFRKLIAIGAAALILLAVVVVATQLLQDRGAVATTQPGDDAVVPVDVEEITIDADQERNNGVAVVGGKWIVDGEDLVQTALARQRFAAIKFGDREWSNYDLTLQARIVQEKGGVSVLFHCEERRFFQFVLGAYNNEWHELSTRVDGKWNRQRGMATRGKLAPQRWHDIRLEVRGNSVKCFLNGRELFHQPSMRFDRGRIGLVGAIGSRFRNIKVTSPEGNVLFQGLPDPSTRPGDHSNEGDGK